MAKDTIMCRWEEMTDTTHATLIDHAQLVIGLAQYVSKVMMIAR